MITIPGWSNALWKVESVSVSGSPKELLISVACSAAASFSAAARSELFSEFASTRRMWQAGHAPCTASTSSDSSTDQPVVSLAGRAEVLPVWLTTVRQPFAFVHVGSP